MSQRIGTMWITDIFINLPGEKKKNKNIKRENNFISLWFLIFENSKILNMLLK